MKKAFLVSISIILFALPTFAAVPVCLFQDNLSGPASGGEGGNGTYIVLRGKNFGVTQSNSKVTINGHAPAQYFNWDMADATGNYETIGLQIASGTKGTGAIVVSTADGSCQFSTATITGLSISSGVTTFTYSGAQLVAGQQVYVNGLTSAPGKPLAARGYTVLSEGLTSSQFEVNTLDASNVSFTSDSGTAGNGGFTVTSGKLYFVGPSADTSPPGTCAAMKSANSYSEPWGMTNVHNHDTFTLVALTSGGKGYSEANPVSTTGGHGTGMTLDITAVGSGGVITALQVFDGDSSGTDYRVGDVVTLAQSGASGGTATVIGYDEQLYTPSSQRTPETYYSCLSPGDTMVFLNGVDFTYGDGTNLHTSLALAYSGSSGNPITFMARPGATVTIGGQDTVNYGARGGASSYLNFYGINFIGSQQNGAAIIAQTSNTAGDQMRLVGTTEQCADCSASSGDLLGGWNVAYETRTQSVGQWIYGNWIYNAGCSNPGGVSNKQYHFIYVNGNGIEIGWNRIGGTGSTAGCAQNGIQLNYYEDNSIGFGNFSAHDNDITGAIGSGINMASVDPSIGPINLYNNVIHHVGLQPASDSASFFTGIAFPGEAPSAGAGTVNVYNNTLWDTSYYLNTSSLYYATSCAMYLGKQSGLTINLVNNIIAQPAYLYTSSANVYFCGAGTSELTGKNNLFYSGSTPRSTSPASSLTSLALPTNPAFVKAADGLFSNYQLQSTSPAIEAGSTSLHSVLDFNGTTRPVPPAIGAFEYGSTSLGDQITVSATPNPATIEEPVTLTATVAQTGNLIPTGNVDFLNGSASLGQASLNGDGTATVVVQSLSAGAYEVVASYSGDASYPPGKSGGFSLQVQSATATGLVASPNPVAAGQTLVLTATVEGSGETSPAGTVSFLSGSNVLGTATLNSVGTATFSIAAPAAGKYSLTAEYTGDASFLASTSSAVSLNVTPAAQSTTTTLVAAPNPVAVGKTLTLTASVKGSGTTVPAGTVSFLNGSTVLGTATLNSSGVATLSTATLALGSHSLTAQYAGNANSLASTSAAVSVTVTAAVQSTTTTLVAAPNPVVAGKTLTLTASVKGSGTTVPAGTVSFLNGVTILGTGTLNSSGVATFPTSALAAGKYSLTAKYAGNANSLASTSTAVSVTVSAPPQSTTTSLAVSPGAVTVGQAVALTATVHSTGATVPAGSVTFFNGKTVLGTVALNASGAATLSTASLAVGAYSFSAEYTGNESFSISTSPAVSLSVRAQATTTGLVASPNPVVAGQALTLTATVKGASTVTPAGTVIFMNGATELGTATLNASGVATLSTATLASGKYTLMAAYAGNASSVSSKSALVSVTVTAKAQSTTTSLAASPNSVIIGQAVALTATVQSTGATKPAGSVTFLNGNTVLGTGVLNASGVATLSTSSLAVGKYNLSAAYAGNAGCLTSTSPAVSVEITPQVTTTNLVASPNPVVAGKVLSLTATVKGSGTALPAGTVTFLNGSAILGTATLNSSGVATLTTSMIFPGTYTLTAQYAGNSSSQSSKSAGVTVVASATVQPTTTSLSASPSAIAVGQALTLTATVHANGAAIPTGAVTFLNGKTVLGTAALNPSGVATLSTASLAAGTYSFTALYTGSAASLTSTSSAVSVTVTAAAQSTTTALAAASNLVTAGQTLTLTATVNRSGIAALNLKAATAQAVQRIPQPTGTVSFMNGSTLLGTGTLSSSGVATLSTASLAPGTYSLTAEYSGSSSSLSSTSTAVSVTVIAEAATVVRGFLLNAPERTQLETSETSGTTLCTLSVPASGTKPGATVTYFSESGSCGQQPTSR
jgi:hypothetical protein